LLKSTKIIMLENKFTIYSIVEINQNQYTLGIIKPNVLFLELLKSTTMYMLWNKFTIVTISEKNQN
jgi:hypothetical protein